MILPIPWHIEDCRGEATAICFGLEKKRETKWIIPSATVHKPQVTRAWTSNCSQSAHFLFLNWTEILPSLHAVKSPRLMSSQGRHLCKPKEHIHYLDYMMLQWITREISSSVHTLTRLCVIWGDRRRAPTPLRRPPFSMRPGKKTGARSADQCKQNFHEHGEGSERGKQRWFLFI